MMALQQADNVPGTAGPVWPHYVLARVACLVGAVLAALVGLVLGLGLLVWWAFQEAEPSPLPWSTVAGMTLAWCTVGFLGWAGVGLLGRHPDRARCAGLAGATLVGLWGVWIASLPVRDPFAHGGGGWGEPWMPECAVGGVLLGYGVWLMWLLRPVHRLLRDGTPPLPSDRALLEPNPATGPTGPTSPSFVLARFACVVGIVLTAFGALLALFVGTGYDTQLATLASVALAVCIIGCLGWAAIGLTDQRADPARRIGRAGAALGCLASVWIVLSRVWPTLSPLRGIGGSLEYPIGGVTFAFGVWLWWLLRKR